MNCEKNREMLQMYHDGELEKAGETYIFKHLSECEDCRLFFRALTSISAGINKSDFPNRLENVIFNSIREKETIKERKLFGLVYIKAISYAAALFFLALSLFFYYQLTDYKEMVLNMNHQIKGQAQTIELLYNTLPPTVVRAKYEHEIIIKPKM